MTITLNQTVNSLDPNRTSENGADSLNNYIAEVSAEIRKEYPDAEIIHNEVEDTYAFRVDADDSCLHEEVTQNVQEITEAVYECGNFWA